MRQESGPVADAARRGLDHWRWSQVIVRRIDEALDAMASYIERHTWAGVLLMVLLAFAVSTADSWFA